MTDISKCCGTVANIYLGFDRTIISNYTTCSHEWLANNG